MEYDYVDLKKAIYYFLTLHPNQKFTVSELYNEIKKEKICKDLEYYESKCSKDALAYFVKSCRDVYTGYKNITYLGSSDSYMIKAEISKYNMTEVENMIKNPQLYPDIRYDALFKDGQTLLHILCHEGKNELLEQVAESFHIDLSTKNGNGESLIDVIPKSNDDTARALLKIAMVQMREISDGRILELKKLNTELQNVNNSLFYQLNDAKHNITVYQTRIYMVCIASFLFILMIMYILL